MLLPASLLAAILAPVPAPSPSPSPSPAAHSEYVEVTAKGLGEEKGDVPAMVTVVSGEEARELDAFLLVVDEVPWGGAFNPALSTLSLEDLDHIEVLRGPAPVMYGATSFVGVVHVVHRSPSDRAREARLSLGSYGSGRGDVALPFRW